MSWSETVHVCSKQYDERNQRRDSAAASYDFQVLEAIEESINKYIFVAKLFIEFREFLSHEGSSLSTLF